MSNLKPCPFCGAPAPPGPTSGHIAQGAAQTWWIGCAECGARGPSSERVIASQMLWDARDTESDAYAESGE